MKIINVMLSSKKFYLIKWSIVLLFITYLTLLIVCKSKFDELDGYIWVGTVGIHALNLIALIIGLAYVQIEIILLDRRTLNWYDSQTYDDYKINLSLLLMGYPGFAVLLSFIVIGYMTKQKINTLTVISCIPSIIFLIVIFLGLICTILMALYFLLNIIYNVFIRDCCNLFAKRIDDSNNEMGEPVEILFLNDQTFQSIDDHVDPIDIESDHENSLLLNNNNSNNNYSTIII